MGIITFRIREKTLKISSGQKKQAAMYVAVQISRKRLLIRKGSVIATVSIVR